MNIRMRLSSYLSHYNLHVLVHIRVHGIPQVGSNVGTQSVNHSVEQLLLFMNLRHYLFFWLES